MRLSSTVGRAHAELEPRILADLEWLLSEDPIPFGGRGKPEDAKNASFIWISGSRCCS